MAASLTVPAELVFDAARRISDATPEEYIKMAGRDADPLMAGPMLRRVAIKLLGGLAVDKLHPELAEHVQAVKGVADARLHPEYLFLQTVAEANTYRRRLIKTHGVRELEAALNV